MKILFVDDQSIQNSIRLGLLEQMARHEVHLVNDYDKAVEFYRTQHPDIVLIDFTLDFGLDTLKKIVQINPTQHIITISDSFDCSETLGCEFCLQHYMKKRVLKKKGIHDLLYLIENFSDMPCEFAHKLDTCISTTQEDEALTLDEENFHEDI